MPNVQDAATIGLYSPGGQSDQGFIRNKIKKDSRAVQENASVWADTRRLCRSENLSCALKLEGGWGLDMWALLLEGRELEAPTKRGDVPAGSCVLWGPGNWDLLHGQEVPVLEMLSNGLEVAMVTRMSKFLLPALKWEKRNSVRCGIEERGTCREARFQSRCGGTSSFPGEAEDSCCGSSPVASPISLTGVTRSDRMHTLLTHYPPPRNKALNRNKDTPTILELSEEAA